MLDRYNSDTAIKGPGYETYVRDLLSRVADVQHHPWIGGKTPDLLVTDYKGRDCIIECTTLSRSSACTHSVHAFPKDPSKLNERLYSSLDGKMRKYGKPLLVIAHT